MNSFFQRTTKLVRLILLSLIATCAVNQAFAFSSVLSLRFRHFRLVGKSHFKGGHFATTKDEGIDEDQLQQETDQDQARIQRQTNNPLRLAVLRLGLTELAWTSPLNYGEKNGTFTCAYCGHELFDSEAKYDSGSGWPSFWRSIEEGAISYKMEWDGRLECQCGRCNSHLGHVFLDGPRSSDVPVDILEKSPSTDPRGNQPYERLPRFCVNGASLTYNKR